MKKNKTLMIVLGVFALVIVTTGASFAFFQYQRTGNTKVNVTSGDIQFGYIEDNQNASLVNAFPVADTVGAVDITGEYEFTVNLTSSAQVSTTYNVILVSDNSDTKNYFTNDQIKFALVKNNTYVANTSSTKGVKLSELSGFTTNSSTGEGLVLSNQNITAGQTDTYKLRIWISDDVSYNNTITNGIETGKYNGYTYSLKVKVTSGTENNYGKPDVVNTGVATESIMAYSKTETGANELRIDNHEITGEQTFATTEYRYFGLTPNNYVTFNNEPWRILGIFDVDDGTGKVEKRVKIIRDQSIGNIAWDTTNLNEWTTSTLNTYLNGEYFNGLSSIAQSMIDNSVYYLGGDLTNSVTSNEMYVSERGTTVFSKHNIKTISKIALMYPSDYGYAAGVTCDATNLGNYSSSCKNTDWLFNNVYQWNLTPLSSAANQSFFTDTFGGIGYYYTNYDKSSVRPVAYLASSIEISGGTGTSFDPFTLK